MVYIVPADARGFSDISAIRFERQPLKKGVVTVQVESYPLFRTGGTPFWADWFEGKLAPLSRAHVGDRVIIPVDAKRPRPCIQPHNKPVHAVISVTPRADYDWDPADGRVGFKFLCGDFGSSKREGDDFTFNAEGVTTCPDCSISWQLFYVAPHSVPKAEKRSAEKSFKGAQKAERKYLARPTRFDRVIDELPTPKAPVVRVTDDEPIEPEGRDSKLEARVRQGQIEKQKREDFKRERRWK